MIKDTPPLDIYRQFRLSGASDNEDDKAESKIDCLKLSLSCLSQLSWPRYCLQRYLGLLGVLSRGRPHQTNVKVE